ncbi:B12-binding domain-containing radical SAM protein [Anthocerotibacter panamensis]|uniref:B12-binding domain-containing radical SAM protein n=1 Tax=Anthocerotibacter panamensis TaxID=2857077 RepID=UPI001C401ADF|nr:radical SAM protein [Anthocerotibacter panamensis]
MRFDKVLVTNLPSPPGYVANKDSMGGFGQLFPKGATLFPVMDLVYLASYLVDKGIPVEVLECLGLELERPQLLERVQALAATGETLLMVVRTSAPTLDVDLALCQALKEQVPALSIGIYGPVVPHVLKRIKQEMTLDYIFQGDPDETVYELVTGAQETQITGLTRLQAGTWQTNSSRGFLQDLDGLPFPKWELFPYRKYQLPRSSVRGETTCLPMQTSRGCPVGCHYCPYPVGQGLAWRHRSPQNVVDELEHLVRDLGVRYVLFRDPIFSLNPNRTVQICEEIIRRKLQVEWRCETRVDCLNPKTLEAMAMAGCKGINFGVESAEVQIQTNVGRRPITQEQFIEAIGLCRSLGIKTFCFFIVGLPGDTVTTILRTIKFAIDIRPDWVQFTAASPFIGTKLRDWAIAQGLVEQDEYAYINSHEAMIGNEHLSKDQIATLLHFAKFLERYLINRRGILKDGNRSDRTYRWAKTVADGVSNRAARVVFALGKRQFERWAL